VDAETDRGPVVPIAPDPERDARVDAYRDRERRRAARALDRYIDLMWVPERAAGDPAAEEAAMRVAGERFVEQVGDYVLARLGERAPEFCGNRVDHRRHSWSDYGVPKICDGVGELHQKAHYGVPVGGQLRAVECPLQEDCVGECERPDLDHPIMQHNGHYGVTPDPVPDGYRGGTVVHAFEGSGERCELCDRLSGQHRSPDYGVSGCTHDGPSCDRCRDTISPDGDR
jgi:hypothetical protein